MIENFKENPENFFRKKIVIQDNNDRSQRIFYLNLRNIKSLFPPVNAIFIFRKKLVKITLA